MKQEIIVADPKPESKFDKLTPEEQTAVRWKAENNLAKEQSNGNKFAQNNPDQYLANAREGIADSPDGVRQLVEQYKREMGGVRKPSHDEQVAHDVTRALVERGMINLNGVQAGPNVKADSSIERKPRCENVECTVPPPAPTPPSRPSAPPAALPPR